MKVVQTGAKSWGFVCDTDLGSGARGLRGIQQPAGLHALELVVEHEGAEAVRHVVVRQEAQVHLVELERQRELHQDLQRNTQLQFRQARLERKAETFEL